VVPSDKRVVAYATAAVFSAAGLAFALSHRYLRTHESSAAPDPELAVPDDVVHREIAMRDGGEIHLIERGEGPPLMLLHGAEPPRDRARPERPRALHRRPRGRHDLGHG
jgi:hypothetical protein